MTEMKTFRRISPLRHAVMILGEVERNLAWLRSQIIVHTASNIRERHRRLLRMIDKNPAHAGAKAILDRMALESEQSNGLFTERSLAAYLSNVMLHDTYIWTGTGKSFAVRIGFTWILIERVRRLTQGSDKISWFLDGVSFELSRFVSDELRVDAALKTIQVNDAGKVGEVIFFEISRRPATSE